MFEQQIQKTILDNDITVITDTMPGTYSAAVGVWIPRGSRHEKKGHFGLSHFYEHLVFKGTSHRTAVEIAAAMEDRGELLEAYTTRQETGFYAVVVGEDISLALEIIADMLMNPKLDAADMEKERKVICEEIRSYDDIAEERVSDLFNAIRFNGSGISRPIAGTVKQVQALTIEDMREYERQVLNDLPLYVCAAGNMDHQKLVDDCLRVFAKKKSGQKSPVDVYASASACQIRQKKELEQSSLFWGTSFYGDQCSEKFRYALSVFNIALGAGMTSRLFQKIREDRGLVYSVYSMVDVYRDCFAWGVALATEPKNLETALDLSQIEVKNFLNSGFLPGELDRIRQNIIGSTRINADSTEKRLMRLADQTLHLGKFVPMHEMEVTLKEACGDEMVSLLQGAFKNADFATAVLQPSEVPIPNLDKSLLL